MTPLPNNGPLASASQGAQSVAPTQPAGATKAASSTANGPAFRALLEQLQEKAAALEASSKDVADPAELSGAVDAARATLRDALTLGDQVLEAFRGAKLVGETGKAADTSNERTDGPRST